MRASMTCSNGSVDPDDPKTQDKQKAQKERQADLATRPGGFQNDPDDPSNPNEVRERHLKKVDKKLDR